MKILVIRFSGLGDIVMLSGVLATLKQQHPEATITLLTDRNNAGLLSEMSDTLSNVIAVNRTVFRQRQWLAALKELWRVVRQLRSSSYDRVYDFQNFGETAALCRLVNAKEKHGAPRKEKYAYPYSHKVSLRESGHRVEQFARIAGLPKAIYWPKLRLSAAAESYRQAQLSTGDQRAIIGLNIGSTQENRRWSHQHFAQLATQLLKQYRVLVFAGPSEQQYLTAFPEGVECLSGLSLPQLCGGIAACSAMISNDTGPAHLAAALNVPLLTLFSTGEDEEVGGLTLQKRHIRRMPINEISPDEVEQQLEALLSGQYQEALGEAAL